ncbi:MAG: hypothetical protein ACI3XQ_08950, partial [Eubacteriales bacterium]
YKGKYIVLTNDIDLNPDWDASTLTAPTNQWSQFFTFSGVLDGKGHTISGLYFSGSSYVGFIRNGADCTVKNLKIDNSALISSGDVCGFIATLKGTSTLDGIEVGSTVTVKGASSVGALAGNAFDGTGHTIVNCRSYGKVICLKNNAGGILGDTLNGTQFTLENCFSAANITSDGSYAGGIVGNVSKSTSLRSCAFEGTVTSADFCGGLVGRNAALLTIEDCVSYGNVNSGANASGILGLCNGSIAFSRCVSLSTLTSESGTTAGFLSEYKSSEEYTEAQKDLEDCYMLAETGINYFDSEGSIACSKLNITYSGVTAEVLARLEAANKLPDNAAFGSDGNGYYGWTVYENKIMPLTVKDLLTEHSFTSTYHAATCLEYDHTDYTCTTCGYSYTEQGFLKSDHVSTGDWIYDPLPTADTGGKRHKVCDVCETVYDIEYVPIEGAVYEINQEWGKDSTTLYQIYTAEDLMAFAAKRLTFSNYKDARVILCADIDLNPGWDASSGLRPTNVLTYMFEFDGIFDGQGHTISGLYYEGNPQNNMTYACFINKLVNATIKDLKIENSIISTKSNYAGLFGTAQGNVTIENVFADITVSSAKYAGGILTQINADSTATFNNVVFAGSVSSSSFAGGILGWDNGQTVSMTNCANYGSVNVTADTCGGLIGQVSGNATLTNCFVSGTITQGNSKNAIFTYASEPKALSLADCYYDSSLASLSPVSGTTGSSYTVTYGDNSSEAFVSVASLSELNGHFEGWIISNDGRYSIPESLFCYVNGHDFEGEGVTTPPTCSSRGFTTRTCKHCGNSFISDYVDMTEHTPSEEWIIDSPATESRMGSKHLECAICGEILDQAIIPKLKTEETESGSPEESEQTETSSETTAEETEKKKGCSGVISLPALIAPVLFIAAITAASTAKSKKKRQ